MRYLFKNRKALLLIKIIDWILKKTIKIKKVEPSQVKKILISNSAHLGDAILATSVIRTLKNNYPNSIIGFIAGSWIKDYLKLHPQIDNIHIIDHWKSNRAPISFLKKLINYWKTRQAALKEIRNICYDIAIDLCFYYPNSIPLLYQTKIPVRIGYTSGGFGPLLTHPYQFIEKKQSAMDYFHDLLQGICKVDKIQPLLISSKNPNFILKKFQLTPRNYIVIHMGSGNQIKEWPAKHWRKVAQSLGNHNTLVFTGIGQREQDLIEHILNICKGINLCNQLNIEEFQIVLAHAKGYLGVDTAASHIVSIAGIPSCVIFYEKYESILWMPKGKFTAVLKNQVNGLRHSVEPKHVIKEIGKMLENKGLVG